MPNILTLSSKGEHHMKNVQSYFVTLLLWTSLIIVSMDIPTNKPISIEELKLKRNELQMPTQRVERVIKVDQRHDIITYVVENEDIKQISLSPFNSIITSKDLSFQKKKETIRALTEMGFIINAEDREMALLEKWERIPFEKISLLNHIAIVLPELSMLIAKYMFDLEESLL